MQTLEAPAPSDTPTPAPTPEVQAPAVPVAPTTPTDWDSLPQEVRQAAEPVYKPLKEKLSEYEKQIEQSKSSVEKAQALDRLVQDKEFQEFWQRRQSGQRLPPERQEEKKDALPYTPEEYSSAYDKALAGDLTALTNLQERLVKSVLSKEIAPAVGQLQQKAREVELSMELSELLRVHPDARELDQLGFLEPALHYFTDRQGKPMAFAYQKAKEAYDKAISHHRAKEAKEIQDKKGGITELPGTITTDQGVRYLESPEAVLKAQIIANMKGEKVQYRVRPKK